MSVVVAVLKKPVYILGQRVNQFDVLNRRPWDAIGTCCAYHGQTPEGVRFQVNAASVHALILEEE